MAQRLSTRSSQPGLIFANVAVKPTNLSTETGEGKQGLQPASVDNSSVTKETKINALTFSFEVWLTHDRLVRFLHQPFHFFYFL